MITPFPYQLIGAEFLAPKRFAILGDEMGVGKTAQAILACDLVNAKKILVVCKAIGRENWKNEFQKFSTHRRSFFMAFNRSPPDCSAFDVTITSFDTFEAVLRATPNAKFDVAIIDEAQKIKNPEAKKTKAILGKGGLIHVSKQMWLLSGTIAPNNASELWVHLFCLGKTKLDFDSFCRKYCITKHTGYGMQILGTNTEPKILNELKDLLKPIFLRRLSDEVGLNLPELFFQEVIVPPGKVDLSLSRRFQPWVFPEDKTAELNYILEKELGIMGAIVNGEFKNEVIEALIASANSLSTVRAYMAQQKVNPVFELVSSELDDGEYTKIVIFAHHRDAIEALEAKFKGAGYKYIKIYGGLEPKKIQKRIEEFQNQKGCQIALLNILSGGTTITMTAANQVLFLEQEFVPGDNAQALKRIHRIGQGRPCFVRVVSLANSYDQQVNRILSRKSEEITKLMSDEGKIKPKTVLRTRQIPQKTDIESIT